MPAAPDDIVKANFVLPTQTHTLKMIPFGGGKFLTERKRINCNNE